MIVRNRDLPPAQELIMKDWFKTLAIAAAIPRLLTPKELINATELPPAEKILPDQVSDFESMLARGDEIRTLKLLPVKFNTDRAHYNEIKGMLRSSVEEILDGDTMTVAPNAYPYFLPPDVNQMIIWVRDEVGYVDYVHFLLRYFYVTQIDYHRTIMFERSRKVDTPLVKGSFPDVRHVHLWTKK